MLTGGRGGNAPPGHDAGGCAGRFVDPSAPVKVAEILPPPALADAVTRDKPAAHRGLS